MTLEEKAKEWRENYKPMGVTCIERYDVTVKTQTGPTKIIENPNPFRIKDGWYDLYLKDLENAYIVGAIETTNELQEDLKHKKIAIQNRKVRIKDLEKQIADLEWQLQEVAKDNDNYQKENAKLKEIIKKIEKIFYSGENAIKRLSKISDILAETEQFLSEVEK